MKRVIEIDKDMYESLAWMRKCDDLGTCYNAIADSEPLNEVLDKIEDDVRKLDVVRIDDGSDGLDTMVDLDEVIGILRSYKESEGE